MRSLLFVLTLAACGPSEEPAPVDTSGEVPQEETAPSEYVFEEDEPAQLLSLGEVELAIFESFEVLQRLNPSLVHDAYAQVKDQTDPECPYFYDYYDYDYWADSCETDAGSSFSGQVGFWRTYNTQDDYYDIIDEGYYSGDAKVTSSDGETFVGSGYAYHSAKRDRYGTNNYHYWNVWGEYGWSGGGLEAGNWVQEDYTVEFSMWTGNYYGSDTATYTSLSGGLSGLSGDINTILLRDFMIYSDELGSECDLEPYGTISVRDNAGNWVDVVFDGPAYWGAWAFQPHCDGCGTAYFRGEEIGPTCIDFSSWLQWENLSW